MALPLVIGTLLVTLGILVMRYYDPAFNSKSGLALIAGVFVLSGVIGFFRAKSQFEQESDCLVRLESHLGLDSKLTAAQSEISDWPEIPERISRPLQWNWKYLFIPVVGVLLLSLSALFFPMAAPSAPPSVAIPREWQALMQELNELEEEEFLEQDYVKEMQEKLEQLQAQEQEEWYKHSSLEAGNTLTKEHQNQMQKMGEAASKAQQALNTISENGENSLSEEQKQELQKQLQEAAKQLAQNGLKPNEELRQMLEKAGAKPSAQMAPEDMKKLQEALDGMNELAEKQEGKDGSKNNNEGSNQRKSPQEAGDLDEEDEDGPTNRKLGEEAEEYQANSNGALQSKDLSASVPGELIEVTQGEHELDMSAATSSAGGRSSHVGQGGSTTYESNYLPEEKRALKNFFK